MQGRLSASRRLRNANQWSAACLLLRGGVILRVTVRRMMEKVYRLSCLRSVINTPWTFVREVPPLGFGCVGQVGRRTSLLTPITFFDHIKHPLFSLFDILVKQVWHLLNTNALVRGIPPNTPHVSAFYHETQILYETEDIL